MMSFYHGGEATSAPHPQSKGRKGSPPQYPGTLNDHNSQYSLSFQRELQEEQEAANPVFFHFPTKVLLTTTAPP